MVEEYYKLPIKRQRISSGVMVWRDREAANSLYEKYHEEISRIDQIFSEFLDRKRENSLSHDALLGRGILYWLLTELQPKRDTQERAIEVWNDIGSKTPLHLREFTKTTTQESFASRYKAILTDTLTFEENIDVIFLVLRSQMLVLMKNFEGAIEVNEIMARRYPTSRYTKDFVKNQIETITDIKTGKIPMPEPSNP